MFAAVLKHKQQVNARAVCALMKELGKMSLKNETGQNVEILANKVHDIAMRIHGCGNPPDNLPSLVAKCFLIFMIHACSMERYGDSGLCR